MMLMTAVEADSDVQVQRKLQSQAPTAVQSTAVFSNKLTLKTQCFLIMFLWIVCLLVTQEQVRMYFVIWVVLKLCTYLI